MLRATFCTSERTCCIAVELPAMRPSAWLTGSAGAARRRRDRPRRARRRHRPAMLLRRQARRVDRRPAAAAAERRGDDAAELLQVDRLGEVVVGAGLERLDRVLGRAVGGDDDRLLAPAVLLEPVEHVEAGAVGQAHVGDDGAVGPVLEMEQRFLHRAGGVEVVALAQQGQLVQRPQVGLVVDDEQAEVRGGGHEVRRMAGFGGLQGGAADIDVELVAPRRVGRQQPVVDARPVSLAELAANVKAQARCRGCGSRKRARTNTVRRRPESARRRRRR